jgi:hypothetical protein
MGYSIGKWLGTDGDGRYDSLEAETRNFKGPRTVEATGMPLHDDNETVVTERIYLGKANNNLMHNEITIVDHALTRPWTADKHDLRERKVLWIEDMQREQPSRRYRNTELRPERRRLSDAGPQGPAAA